MNLCITGIILSKGCVIMLPMWAVKERDLGGHIFKRSARLVPPSQWRFSALWDGCLLAIYEGDSFPAPEYHVYDPRGRYIGSSYIKHGQLIRVWPVYLREDSEHNTVMGLKIKHAYRREIDEVTVPSLYAYYKLEATIKYNNQTSVYDIISNVRINTSNQLSMQDEDLTRDSLYLKKFLQTVVNELIYLEQDVPMIPGRKFLQLNKTRFIQSSFRYQNFLFFMGNMSWILEREREEKRLETLANKSSNAKTVIELEGLPKNSDEKYRKQVVRDSPKYTRSKYPVLGEPCKDICITTKTSLSEGCAYEVNSMWFVIDWPDEHAHAFWVCKLSDKDHFLERVDHDKYRFHLSYADSSHPVWRFYHTPGGYDNLRALCGF